MMHCAHVGLEVIRARVRTPAVRTADRLAALVADLLVATQVRLPTEQYAAVATRVCRRRAATAPETAESAETAGRRRRR